MSSLFASTARYRLTALAICGLLGAGLGCDREQEQVPPPVEAPLGLESRTQAIDPFQELVVKGGVEVEVEVLPTPHSAAGPDAPDPSASLPDAEISGPVNYLPRLTLREEGEGRLVVEMKGGIKIHRPLIKLKTHRLSSVRADGAPIVHLTGLHGGALAAHVTEATKLRIAGAVERLELSANRACRIEASELTVGELDLRLVDFALAEFGAVEKAVESRALHARVIYSVPPIERTSRP